MGLVKDLSTQPSIVDLIDEQGLDIVFFLRISKPLIGIYTKKHFFFSFNNVHYMQIDVVAIESPLGPMLANIFDVGCVQNKLKVELFSFSRHVDDIFKVCDSNDDLKELQILFNTLHATI